MPVRSSFNQQVSNIYVSTDVLGLSTLALPEDLAELKFQTRIVLGGIHSQENCISECFPSCSLFLFVRVSVCMCVCVCVCVCMCVCMGMRVRLCCSRTIYCPTIKENICHAVFQRKEWSFLKQKVTRLGHQVLCSRARQSALQWSVLSTSSCHFYYSFLLSVRNWFTLSELV